MKRTIVLFVCAALLTACNPNTWNLDIVGMISGSSPQVDQRFDDSKAYNDQHGMPVVYADAESYRVYVCTDTHVDRSRTNWETFIKDYHNDLNCPLAVRPTSRPFIL